MAVEFTVNGQRYKSGKLDVFRQQHIIRRLAPVFGSLAPAMRVFSSDPAQAFKLMADAVAKLSDADVEYIQKTALAVVQREQLGTWASVLPSGGVLAFDDIGLLELNEITFAVLRDNLSPFFSGLAQRGWLSR